MREKERERETDIKIERKKERDRQRERKRERERERKREKDEVPGASSTWCSDIYSTCSTVLQKWLEHVTPVPYQGWNENLCLVCICRYFPSTKQTFEFREAVVGAVVNNCYIIFKIHAQQTKITAFNNDLYKYISKSESATQKCFKVRKERDLIEKCVHI